MSDREYTVWQMMAAFASDEYELREVAPGEFEIVAIEQMKEAEASHTAPEAEPSADAATTVATAH